MSNIKVPYIPVSNFDPSEVAKSFTEDLPEDKNSEQCLLSSLKTADGKEVSEILLILTGMGMEKYVGLFQQEHILLDTFLQLNDSDLLEIGILDPKDREIIMKNLSIHQKTENDCIIPENPIEDLKIMKNISHQLLLLQNYCAYLDLQMKKYKFTDYRINREETACTYLKAFTETALLQSRILCNTIYGQGNVNCLIDKILKANNLVLPKALQNSLPKRKAMLLSFFKTFPFKTHMCGFCVFKLMAVIGVASAVVLSGSYFIGEWDST